MDMDNSAVIARDRVGVGEWEEGKESIWKIHDNGQRLDLMDEHSIQCTDDVL